MPTSPTSLLNATLLQQLSAYYVDHDEAHLTPFFVQASRYLHHVAALRLRVNCAQRREDLVQATLLKVLQALRQQGFALSQSGGQPGYVLAWLSSIQHNLFINEMRLEQPYELTENLLIFSDVAVSEPGDAQLEEQNKARSLLTRALAYVATLTKRQQQVFALYYLEGVPYQAAADQLGITVGAYKSTLHLVVRALQAWGRKQEETPTEETYAAFRYLSTDALFADGPAHQRAAKGFYTSKRREAADRKKRTDRQQNRPVRRTGRPPKPTAE